MLAFIYRAIFFPAKRSTPVRFWRGIARAPVVFDLISLVLQFRDISAVSKLKAQNKLDDPHFESVRSYNAGVTRGKLITTTRRAEEYYEVLTLPRRDLWNESLLIVGPRNVQELFMAWTFGYSWANISAIDLYSTNQKIVEMNMEEMSFPEETFDAVSMANTLSYAKDTRKALSEVARVLKVGGRFAFSATYDPNEKWPEDAVSGAKIKAILEDLNLQVYVHYSNDKVNSLGRTQTSHTFAVRKTRPGEKRFDDFHV